MMTDETRQDCKCPCETVCGTGNYHFYNFGGIVPYIGENGNWFIGCKDTGVSASGSAGKDGKSAYEAAVEHGFTGTEEEWLASLKGADGAEGPQGPKGEDGTSLRYDILFEGNANTVNGTYSLNKPVAGYRLVVIFGGGHNKDVNEFAQKNGVVLSADDIRYTNVTGWSIVFLSQAYICGCFTDSRTFKILRSELGGTYGWDYVAVTKIIGIY